MDQILVLWPIMRNGDLLPAGVIELCGFRTLHAAVLEAPAAQQKLFLRLCNHTRCAYQKQKTCQQGFSHLPVRLYANKITFHVSNCLVIAMILKIIRIYNLDKREVSAHLSRGNFFPPVEKFWELYTS